MVNCSVMFQFILKSCPLLNEFRLNGYVRASGALTLDFRELVQLKYVDIGLGGCRYYTFNGNFDTKWINLDECILEEEISKKIKRSFRIISIWPGWMTTTSKFNWQIVQKANY